MVLTATGRAPWAWPALALPLLTAALLTGCITRGPLVRLPAPAGIAVAYAVDLDDRTVGDVPDSVKSAVAEALAARNLELKPVTLPPGAGRDSRRRLEAAAAAAPDAPYVLLVEARPSFYSQLSGRFRWTVDARLTLARRGALGEALTSELQLPAILTYVHEGEDRALEVVAPVLADRVGGLADDFLAGTVAPATPAAAAAERDAIYFVLVDRFANGAPGNDAGADLADPAGWHGGDLQGVLDHLDELQALGVGALWLSPISQGRGAKIGVHGAFHGYWVEELDQVDPRFGDEALVRRLSDELHRRGMKLYLDLVLNHVSYEAPLLKAHPEWFHRNGDITDWNDPAQLVTHDVHGLPDLAQEQEAVYAHLLAASLRWIELARPDGFRLDAVKHVPSTFWSRFVKDVRARAGEDFFLLGEDLEGDPRKLSRTLATGGFSAVFDFPLYFALDDVFCKGKPVARLAATLSADRLYGDPSRLVTLADNHDLPRLASACAEAGSAAQLLTVLVTARGRPSISYGTEAALTGAKEPENRQDMRFDAQPLRPLLARLLALRAASPALRGAGSPIVAYGEELVAYLRVGGGEVALVAVNRGATPVTVQLPASLAGARLLPLLGGEPQGSSLLVPARSTAVALVEGVDAGALAAAAPWRVQLRVVDAPAAAAGDALFLVGSGLELGGWDLGGAVPLAAGGGSVLLPRGSVYEYKLVLRRAGGELVWEAGPNRSLFVPLDPEESAGRLELRWRAS